jgi:flagellar motor component MotA
MVVEGLHSILERREPLVIGEVVNSYLPDQYRIKFSEEMSTLSQDRQGAKPREAAA